MEIKENKTGAIVKYGRVVVESSLGDITYSYKVSTLDKTDDTFQIESVSFNFEKMSEEEIIAIDEMLFNLLEEERALLFKQYNS